MQEQADCADLSLCRRDIRNSHVPPKKGRQKEGMILGMKSRENFEKLYAEGRFKNAA